MAFDKNLDVEKFSRSKEFENTKITVAVFSYNEGTPKLQISRENVSATDGGYRFAKLGRLTKDEIEAILPLIQEAIPHL